MFNKPGVQTDGNQKRTTASGLPTEWFESFRIMYILFSLGFGVGSLIPGTQIRIEVWFVLGGIGSVLMIWRPAVYFMSTFIQEATRGSVDTCIPCRHLDSAARRIYCKKTYDRVFSQCIRDTRDEYIEALANSHIWHARWIHARGILIFWSVVSAHASASLAVRMISIVRIIISS
jgi:hypothetical protein